MVAKQRKKPKLEKDYEKYFRYFLERQELTTNISLQQPPPQKIVPSVATGAAFEEPIKTT